MILGKSTKKSASNCPSTFGSLDWCLIAIAEAVNAKIEIDLLGLPELRMCFAK
jgi:hypothetical protein